MIPQVFRDSSSPPNPKPPSQYPSPTIAQTPLLYGFDASIITLYPPIAPHSTNDQPTPASVGDCSSLANQARTIPPLVDSSTWLTAATIASIIPPPR